MKMVDFNSKSITFTRVSNEEDVDSVLELICKSTQGKSKLTQSSLRACLLENYFIISPSVTSQDSSLEIDTKLFKSNRTPACSIIAKLDDKTVAYALWHYHYSPWPGHCKFIDDIYVLPEFRRNG